MIEEIKCNICKEVVGTLEKDNITDDDAALYAQMTMCPNGHLAVILSPTPGDDE